ncbi:MAG: choice-of-anchor D domain-containing protein [Myxococcaceae bacterium]
MQARHGQFAAAAVFTSLLALSGCECRTQPGGSRIFGDIGVVYEDGTGTLLTSRDAVYDFGSVFMGQGQPLKLVVKNMASGALDLERLEKESGDSVDLGLEPGGGIFQVRFEPRRLEALEVAEFEMTFLAPANESDEVVPHEVRLILRAANAPPGAETAVITLKALAIPGRCEVPLKLDFGSVARGDAYTTGIPLPNLTQLETVANVGDPYSSSGDHQAFSFTASSARGNVALPPGAARRLELSFKPTESKSYLAFIKVRVSTQCPEYPVQLVGTGVDSVLRWAPVPLDFGYVTPGVEVTRELTFTNLGNTEARVSDFKAASAEYRVVPAAGQDPTRLTVPPLGGTATLTVAFKPGVLGPRTSRLTFATSLARQASGDATLKGYGGGPDIQVTPSPQLAFGKVAYFAGANPPSFQTRRLTVMNVGTRPAVPDPNANLKLGTGGTGDPWTLVATNANSSADELQVRFVTPYPAAGFPAIAGQNFVDLEVKLIPGSLGAKTFDLTIASNDADEPATTIHVSADAVELPDCKYSLTPTALNFGLVAAPGHRDLSFTLKNLGQNPGELCLVSGVDIGAGSDPVFTLPAGAITSKELQPDESMVVLVRATPQGATPSTISSVQGSVQLFISSVLTPTRTVTLSATLAPSCLTVTPDDLDFGTVQKGCNSTARTFTLYNTCATTITLMSVAVQSGAGQPAGGPNCTGTSPCAEFVLLSAPPIPSGGLALTPGGAAPSFTMKYAPIDLGTDSGAVAVRVVQAGTNVTYLVTLQGKGDTVGLNTDIFSQDLKPKADILLVVDNSGSMSDNQQALAANFSSFMKYAIAAGVDYHLAVTTTDMDPGGEQGLFVSGPGHPEKVLTPATLDVENKFKAKVNVGTGGSYEEMCFEPALKALTAPLITDPAANGGFLRTDATLSVVCISDELEQSPLPVPTYYNQLLNVKGVKNATLFTLSAIAGMFATAPAGCGAYADDGRYAMMVAQTNGVKDSICTTDWAKTLEGLSKISFGFRTNFFLNAPPDLSGGKALDVKIDGVSVPQVNARGSAVWSYDPVGNSVNFEPSFVPEPGQTLSLTYYVTCL